MVRRSHTPAGPLAFVALGLFVLTWASLRLWRSPESEQPQAVTPAQTIAQPAAVSAHVAISVATNVSPEPEVAVVTPTAPPLPATPAALALDQFSTLPAVAELAPPVATRVEFDPVVTLEPDVELMLAPALSPASNVNLPAMEIRREIAPQGQQSQVARAQLARAPQLDRAWPYPVMLVTDLNILAQQTATQTWASEVLIHLDALFAVEELDSPAASMVLERLERLSDAAKNVAPQCRDQEERALLARSSFGLTRRLIIWRHVMELSQASFVVGADTPHDDQRVAKAVAAAETFFTSTPSWSDYLLLRRIRGALVLSTRSERGDLARRVLERLEASHLTKEQKKLLSQAPVLELAAAVKPWAAEPIDSARLLDALEQLEVGHASTAAQAVAAAYQRLRWSDDKPASELADDLDTYYRNANVRVAISGELLNKLLPELHDAEEEVDDQVLGARVFGRSQTSSRLRVVLLPDARRLRLGLEAIGEVDSDTAATKGPATFYSQGNSRYHARKMLSVDRQGLRVWRSAADVETDSELTDWETDYDALPFVGLLARSIAKQQHDENYHAAKHEIRDKVASRAEERFDQQVNEHLRTAEQEFITTLYNPLQKLQLEPTAIDLRTTSDHLIARYRVASRNQVAAFTPRPAAPGGSALSIQLHQSTLNNVLEQLKLDGRRSDLESLYRDIARTFGKTLSQEQIDELPERVTVQFADRDAVRVYCDAGRLMLVIKIAELAQGRDHKWKNFTVQAYYVPNVETLDARLVRDGTIELIGERLGFRDQIALRGIFTKVLSKNRSFDLVPEKIARDPRLKSYQITQFTITDGWIGLAVGGKPAAVKPQVANEPRPAKQR